MTFFSSTRAATHSVLALTAFATVCVLATVVVGSLTVLPPWVRITGAALAAVVFVAHLYRLMCVSPPEWLLADSVYQDQAWNFLGKSNARVRGDKAPRPASGRATLRPAVLPDLLSMMSVNVQCMKENYSPGSL